MKKTISFLLAIVMVLSLVPVTAFAAGTVTIGVGSSEQTVSAGDTVSLPVTVESNSGISSAKMKVVFDADIFELTSFSVGTISGDTVNTDATKNMIAWMKADQADSTKTGVLCYINLKVKEGVTATGEQTINVTYYTDEDDFLDVNSDNVTATFNAGKVTLGTGSAGGGAGDSTDGYTASVDAVTETVDNDGTTSNVTVNVVVNKAFNSAELELSYDKDLLKYEGYALAEGQNLPQDDPIDVNGADGVITIRDYGAGYAAGNAYTLTFTSIKGGVANVAVTSAGFSTKEEAETTDLIDATIGDKASVTINHKVTVNNGTPTYVTPGENYTFTIEDYNSTKYTYTVTATEGSAAVDSNRISVGANGQVTITDVSDTLSVTVSKTTNSYNITWTDTENAVTTEKPATQNYDTAVTFTVKAGQAPNGTVDGYHYNVLVYLTGDNNKTSIPVTSSPEDAYAEKAYTVAAENISGNITIEVTKETVSASQTTVTIDGEYTELSQDDSVLTSNTLIVNKNESVTLTLNKEIGYNYTLQTKVGEANPVEVEVGEDGSFIISVGDSAMTLIITKTLDTATLNVSQYVQLDGKNMWLVTIGNAQISDKTYKYSGTDNTTGENFYWSSEYNAYCFLVVENANTAETAVKEKVAAHLSLVDADIIAISYNGNVNLTKDANNAAVIDVNDAQLVWNMYSAVYSDITTNVTVQKFLEADMDGIVGLSTGDAAAVVAKIN